MKKSLLFVILAISLVLVGCGKTPAPTTDTATDTVVADQGDDTANVPADDAAPTVDASKTTALATCLTEKGMKMYGTEWCGHCKNQKALFGDAFQQVTYIDCDAQRQVCLDAGVRGFPTWIDSKGTQYPGTQTLEKLAESAGCAM